MSNIVPAVFGSYGLVALILWPYYWAKKTNRSQEPIIRRLIGLGHASIWPYTAVRYFANRRRG